jgi:diguanylate cyclase (GGDEF)-like protein
MIEKNRILIVDDEAANIKALMHILKDEYTVFAERDAVNVVESAKRLLPDVILLDVLMPKMDGFEVIAALKKDHETRRVPVIFITALVGSDDEVRGFELGAADYINKPFSAPVVQMRVRSQIKIVNAMRTIQNLSATDELTGIGNRRFFNTLLNQEWERAKRQRTPLSFIIWDIDNFKRFNDSHGHVVGDEVLRHVATIISRGLTRAIDRVARWGGEEFAVILPDTELNGARKVGEALRQAVEKEIFTIDAENIAYITMSGGLHCVIPERIDDYSLAEFIPDADRALYAAKRSGKNKIIATDDLDKETKDIKA